MPKKNSTITEKTDSYLEYIGSMLASIVILATVFIIGAAVYGYANLEAVSQQWFVGVVVPLVIMSAIQAFGAEVYDVFTKNRNE